jgi:hypothetical protein
MAMFSAVSIETGTSLPELAKWVGKIVGRLEAASSAGRPGHRG